MRRRLSIAAVTLLMLLGSTGWSTPAEAGDADSTGVLTAAVYNVTPYSMSLVASSSDNGWQTFPQGTVLPGGGPVYGVKGSTVTDGGICIGTWKNSFNGFMTYRFDVLGGPDEYLTVAFHGDRSHSSDVGCGEFAPPGDVWPSVDVWDTTAPPVADWAPSSGTAPAPLTTNPQITYTHNSPFWLDQSFGVKGDWSVDARTPLGQALDDVLNNICGQNPASCSFEQTGPLVWGTGASTIGGQKVNCSTQGGGGTGNDDGFGVEYTAAQQASLTVGGGVTLATEVKLFGIIGSKISVKVEAEHEWTEINSFTRSSTLFMPSRTTGTIWTAPTIGTVSGTLRLRTGTSTFTVTNFSQTRSGVTKNDLTPAYISVAEIRPTTADELAEFCPAISSSTRGRSTVERAPALVPGRGVGPIKLGRPRDARVLGRPLHKDPRANTNALANDCRVLDPRCEMVPGRGGTWVYDDLSVIFGADHRVSALIYAGPGRTTKGVGVGSGRRAVQDAYPGLSCLSYTAATNCALRGRQGKHPVQTVFHFIETKGRTVCDRIMTYRVAPGSQRWGA